VFNSHPPEPTVDECGLSDPSLGNDSYDIDLLVSLCIIQKPDALFSTKKSPMKLGTVALLGLLIAGTIKASEERVITIDAIGASLFSDAELLTIFGIHGRAIV
jgi:hypothetical protein